MAIAFPRVQSGRSGTTSPPRQRRSHHSRPLCAVRLTDTASLPRGRYTKGFPFPEAGKVTPYCTQAKGICQGKISSASQKYAYRNRWQGAKFAPLCRCATSPPERGGSGGRRKPVSVATKIPPPRTGEGAGFHRANENFTHTPTFVHALLNWIAGRIDSEMRPRRN